jgi:hypothetical protein
MVSEEAGQLGHRVPEALSRKTRDMRPAARPGAGDDLIPPVAVEVAAGSDLDAPEEIGSIGEETGHLGDDRARGVELEGLYVRAAPEAGAVMIS